MKLAGDAHFLMGFSGGNELDARTSAALDLFGVNNDATWQQRLNHAYLTPNQKQRVEEMAYYLLVHFANHMQVWNWSRGHRDPKTAQWTLELLAQAESFH